MSHSIDTNIIERTQILLGDEFSVAVTEFLEDADGYVSAIVQGFNQGDNDAVKRASHTLKSNSQIFGLMTISKHAAEINAKMLSNNKSEIGADIEALQIAYQEAKVALVAYI